MLNDIEQIKAINEILTLDKLYKEESQIKNEIKQYRVRNEYITEELKRNTETIKEKENKITDIKFEIGITIDRLERIINKEDIPMSIYYGEQPKLNI